MRGQSISLAGSVFARANGRWTAITPPLPGDQPGRKRRPSLGTFATEGEARAELRRANLEGFDAQVRPTPSELSQMTLEAYLNRWVLDLADEEHDGRIVRSTRRDYEQVVVKHIIPELGRVRLGAMVELLEGRATGRTETVSPDDGAEVRERLQGALDELASRRERRQGDEQQKESQGLFVALAHAPRAGGPALSGR
jgi:hypothetical protein